MGKEFVGIAFFMALIGGVAMAAGGLISFAFKNISSRLLSIILGFTAGIMLYAAFGRFLPTSQLFLELVYDEYKASIYVTIAFFIGMLTTLPIDLAVDIRQKKIFRSHIDLRQHPAGFKALTFLIFLSISIHNFVEGIATYLSFMSQSTMAIPVVLSIVAHNIPEGILIAMAVYKITFSKRKALLFCAIGGIADPLGAIFAYSIFQPFYSIALEGIIRGILAGLLVNTALDELIPGAELRGSHTISIRSIVAGMLFMAIIMILLH